SILVEDIESIEMCSFPMIPYPCFSVQQPKNTVAATFSFPHAAAMVALGIPAGPDWFDAEQMEGQRAKAARQRVQLLPEPAGQDPAAWGLEEGVLKVPSRARVRTRSGSVYEKESKFALGDPWPGAPAFGDEEIKSKFRRQAR